MSRGDAWRAAGAAVLSSRKETGHDATIVGITQVIEYWLGECRGRVASGAAKGVLVP